MGDLNNNDNIGFPLFGGYKEILELDVQYSLYPPQGNPIFYKYLNHVKCTSYLSTSEYIASVINTFTVFPNYLRIHKGYQWGFH